MNPDWIGAFAIGFVGAGHCLGMCGGIASMLSIGQARPSKWIPLFYNLGRLISYALFGALVGGALSSLASLSSANSLLGFLRVFAGVFMVLLALYIGRWWFGLLQLEKLGQGLWKYISPFASKLLPLRHPTHAMPFGFIWGWLPCGLVYSTLTWSAVSGSALDGALIMFAFGLGTLPTMLLVGYGSQSLKSLQQSPTFRNIAASLLLLYGLYTIYQSLSLLSLNL